MNSNCIISFHNINSFNNYIYETIKNSGTKFLFRKIPCKENSYSELITEFDSSLAQESDSLVLIGQNSIKRFIEIYCLDVPLFEILLKFSNLVLGSYYINVTVKNENKTIFDLSFENIKLNEEWIENKWIPFINCWLSEQDKDPIDVNMKNSELFILVESIKKLTIKASSSSNHEFKESFKAILELYNTLHDDSYLKIENNLDLDTRIKNIFIPIIQKFIYSVMAISALIKPTVNNQVIGNLKNIYLFSYNDETSTYIKPNANWFNISKQLHSMNYAIEHFINQKLLNTIFENHDFIKEWKENIEIAYNNILIINQNSENTFLKLKNIVETINGKETIEAININIYPSQKLLLNFNSWHKMRMNIDLLTKTNFKLINIFEKAFENFCNGISKPFSVIRDLTLPNLIAHGYFTLFPTLAIDKCSEKNYYIEVGVDKKIKFEKNIIINLFNKIENENNIISTSKSSNNDDDEINNKKIIDSLEKDDKCLNSNNEYLNSYKIKAEHYELFENYDIYESENELNDENYETNSKDYIYYFNENCDELKLYTELYCSNFHFRHPMKLPFDSSIEILEKNYTTIPQIDLLLYRPPMKLPFDFSIERLLEIKDSLSEFEILLQNEEIPFFLKPDIYIFGYKISKIASIIASNANFNEKLTFSLLKNLIDYADREYTQLLKEMIDFARDILRNYTNTIPKEKLKEIWALMIDLVLDFEIACGLDLTSEKKIAFSNSNSNLTARIIRLGKLLRISEDLWSVPYKITLPLCVQHQFYKLAKDYYTKIDDLISYSPGILHTMLIIGKTLLKFSKVYSDAIFNFNVGSDLSDHHFILKSGMYLAFTTMMASSRGYLISKKYNFFLFAIGLTMYRYCLVNNNIASINILLKKEDTTLIETFATILFYIWIFGGDKISSLMLELVNKLINTNEEKLHSSLKNSIVIGYLLQPNEAKNHILKLSGNKLIERSNPYYIINEYRRTQLTLGEVPRDILHKYLIEKGELDYRIQEMIANIYNEIQ